MKNILIINGHPDKESYNYALSDAYAKGASKTNANVTLLNIAVLDFNPNLAHGYNQRTELEPDLLKAIDLLKAADHLVWVFPMWWYSYPALMKGFIDRTFLPEITYRNIPNKPFPEPLLKGKTARLIITADAPKWYNFLFMKQPAIQQLKYGTLQYCGVKPVKVSYIAPIRSSDEAFRTKWIAKITRLGEVLG